MQQQQQQKKSAVSGVREPANDKNRVRQNKMHTQNSEMYSPKNKTKKLHGLAKEANVIYIYIYEYE